MWDELQSTVDKVEDVRSHSRIIHPKMVFNDNEVIENLPSLLLDNFLKFLYSRCSRGISNF